MSYNNQTVSVTSVAGIETVSQIFNSDSIMNVFCKIQEDINTQNECGWTPLYRTIIAGNNIATDHLLKLGADPNVKCNMGETALFQAVEMESLAQVDTLLSYGADPNIPQSDGLIPLHAGVVKQDIQIVEVLLQKGSNPNHQNKHYGQTPVHFAIKNSVKASVLLLLVQYNGSLIIKDKYGKRPIDYAETDEMKETLKMLRLQREDAFRTPQKEYSSSYTTPHKIHITQKPSVTESNLKEKEKEKETYLQMHTQHFTAIESSPQNQSNPFCQQIYHENNFTMENRFDSFVTNKEPSSKINTPLTKGEVISDVNPLDTIYSNYNSNNPTRKEDCSQIINTNTNVFTEIQEGDYINCKCNDNDNDNNNNNDNENDNEFLGENGEKLNENITIKGHICSNCHERERQGKTNRELVLVTPRGEEELSNDDSLEENELSYTKSKTSYIVSDLPVTSVKKVRESSITNGVSQLDLNDNSNNVESESPSKAEKSQMIAKKRNFSKISYHTKSTENKENNSNLVNRIQIPQQDMGSQSPVQNNTCIHNSPRVLNTVASPQYSNAKHTSCLISSHHYNPGGANMTDNDIPVFRYQTHNNSAINYNSYTNYTSRSNSRLGNPNDDDGKNHFRNRKKFLSNINENFPPNDRKLKKISAVSDYYERKMSPGSCVSRVPQCLDIPYMQSESSISTKDARKLHEWLGSINLQCYYTLFLDKGIYNVDKYIEGMKDESNRVTYQDIENIGIRKPGHVYRILLKLEIDAMMVNESVVNLLLKNDSNKIKQADQILRMSDAKFVCCGTSYTQPKKADDILCHDLSSWLKMIKLQSLKQNFVHNGFDLIEYFILLMFSSNPVTDKMLEDSLHIYCSKERKGILSQLSKDMKTINAKLCSIIRSEYDLKLENEMNEESCHICQIY